MPAAPAVNFNVPGLPKSSIDVGDIQRCVAICQDSCGMQAFCARLRDALSGFATGAVVFDNIDISTASWSAASLFSLFSVLEDAQAVTRRFKAYACELDDDAVMQLVGWLRILPPEHLPSEIHLTNNQITKHSLEQLIDVLAEQRGKLAVCPPPVWIRLEKNKVGQLGSFITDLMHRGIACLCDSVHAPARRASAAVIAIPAFLHKPSPSQWWAPRDLGNCPAELLAAALGRNDFDRLGVSPRAQHFRAFLLNGGLKNCANYQPKVFNVYSGVPYFRPDGWLQFRVEPWFSGGNGDRHINYPEIKSWPVAYHGTDCAKAESILRSGLRKPGELPWVAKKHGAAGGGRQGSVYLSPSLGYASHPVYSALKKLGTERYVQVVFKVKVQPGSYRERPSTLNSGHWHPGVKMDPNFSNRDSFEWLIDADTFDQCTHVIVGLMVREIGLQVDKHIFGACPQLEGHALDPEFVWTEHVQRTLFLGGFNEGSSGNLCMCDGPCDLAWLAKGGICAKKAECDEIKAKMTIRRLVGTWYDCLDGSKYTLIVDAQNGCLTMITYAGGEIPRADVGAIRPHFMQSSVGFSQWLIIKEGHTKYFLDDSFLPHQALWRNASKTRARARRWSRKQVSLHPVPQQEKRARNDGGAF
mmetsp:Transcript_163152/g.523183  ORF Transcript_163152/g.523183 Transcript_163152/m.523183 type:complete len:641 (-) Transcript_163152:109-2031(-)